MSAFVAWLASRSGLPRILACLVVIAAAGSLPQTSVAAEAAHAAGGDVIRVFLDQARVIKLPGGTATLVVGNPLIADVSVQAGGVLVVTGKSYGVTNLVALDRNGGLLMEHPIEVQGPREHVVTVYRGMERESYSCTPKCERRITLGDSAAYFTTTLTQTGSLNTTAQGGTPGAAPAPR
jgi:hypothetical protein